MKLNAMVLQEHPIQTAATAWTTDTYIDTDAKDAFSAFVSKKYASIVDDILLYKFGDRQMLFDDDAIEDDEWLLPMKAYLFSRWRYIMQAMEYLDAEYNPIENYSGVEDEKTITDSAKKTRTITDDMKQRQDTDNYPQYTDQFTVGQHTDTVTPAGSTVSTTTDKQTVEHSVAPFESSSYFPKDKTETSGAQTGGATKVQAVTTYQGNEQHSNAQRIDQDQHAAHIDTHTVGAHKDEHTIEDDAFRDTVHRTLTKSGNIGVLTSSAMLTQDDAFWRAFRWLDDLAHEAATILASSVWSM